VLKDQEVYEQALAKKEGRDANTYHGVYSTHPRNDDRLKTVVRAAKKLSVQDYQDSDRSGYYGMIDGMVWGPSIKQGILVGNQFTHPDLAFELQLPESWNVNNYPEALVASNPKTGAMVQIGAATLKKDESLAGLLKRMSHNKKLKVKKTDYGVTGRTRVEMKDGEEQPARISAIALENSLVLTFLGTAEKEKFAATDKILLELNRSFRRLSRQEIDSIEVPQLQIVTRTDQSFESLAEHSAIDYEAVNILRLLNRAYPDGDITKIDKLKTIVFDD
jgi:predicted Zn-dependent protease